MLYKIRSPLASNLTLCLHLGFLPSSECSQGLLIGRSIEGSVACPPCLDSSAFWFLLAFANLVCPRSLTPSICHCHWKEAAFLPLLHTDLAMGPSLSFTYLLHLLQICRKEHLRVKLIVQTELPSGRRVWCWKTLFWQLFNQPHDSKLFHLPFPLLLVSSRLCTTILHMVISLHLGNVCKLE